MAVPKFLFTVARKILHHGPLLTDLEVKQEVARSFIFFDRPYSGLLLKFLKNKIITRIFNE